MQVLKGPRPSIIPKAQWHPLSAPVQLIIVLWCPGTAFSGSAPENHRISYKLVRFKGVRFKAISTVLYALLLPCSTWVSWSKYVVYMTRSHFDKNKIIFNLAYYGISVQPWSFKHISTVEWRIWNSRESIIRGHVFFANYLRLWSWFDLSVIENWFLNVFLYISCF